MGVERDTLNPGDHIYSYRQMHAFSHHGIYVGKGTVTTLNNEEVEISDAVIHFMGLGKFSNQTPCEICGHIPGRATGVVITCLDCFLQRHSLYVYRYDVSYLKLRFKRSGTCSTNPSEAAEEVVETAFDYLKNQSFGKYNFFFRNCEDFATYCKTGEAQSNQSAGFIFGFGLGGLFGYNVIKALYEGSSDQDN
ncbi:hypothetical protein CCACVL1_18022 [Corchorus capsularis]|uniref:LRAT domain-containing protein n=1 Tax=Corchorus capsularis TaxID=210143 RepID=A0A1R3HND3_COCAP|nr:hypothetical protein CCACVL1_18022 [Corchorus capsularis]